MLARTAAVLGILALVLGAVAASAASGSPVYRSTSTATVGAGSIVIAATEDYGYQPANLQQVPTDANISVRFTDQSALQHSFTITSREGYVIPTGYTDEQLSQFLSTYPPMFSLLVNGSGEVATGNFTSPATPGWYEFVCDVSGHFQNGMYGFVAFGENLPPNLTKTPRTGLGLSSITPLDGVAIAVIFLAFLASLVLWRRRPPKPDKVAVRPRNDTGTPR
jgi:plastocyanin